MNKKLLLAVSALLLNAILLHAQIPTNGLIGHWNFNGNVKDVSGHGLNGTPYNITSGAGQSGNPNTAAVFNGTSSHVDVLYNPIMNLSTYSICAIIKVNGYYTGLCQGNMILERGTQFGAGYYFLDYCDNFWDSSCVVTGDTSKFIFNTDIDGKSCYNVPCQYTPAIISGQWYCVVGTFDGNVFKIYVNGVLKTTITPYQNFATNTSTEGITIGSSYNYSPPSLYPYWVNGTIDDICLYNRALTTAEVSNYCGAAYQQSANAAFILQNYKTNMCKGDTLHLNYDITGNFNSNNVFTAQLSDAAGSFASPVNIGSVTSNAAGTIICTIPTNTPSGLGYRIRIVSSSPATTSYDNGVDIGISLPATISTSVSPGDTICAGATATFTATLTNIGSSASLQWLINGVVVPGANGTVFTTNSLSNGDYVSANLTNGNPCTQFASSGITMTVTPKTVPSATLEVTPDTNVWPGLQVTFKAVTTNAGKNPKFQWQVNFNNVKNATDSVWSTTDLKDNDVVGCAVTSDNPCSIIKYIASKRVTMHIPTSVHDINSQNNFTIYPNPNKGVFNLVGRTDGPKEINIEILNSIGQVVYRNRLQTTGNEFSTQIDLGKAGNGIYLVRYNSGTEISTKTFMINE